MPVVEAPSLSSELGIGHAAAALVLLVAPQLAGAALEARLLLLAERGDARRWIAGGQAFVAACLLSSTAAPSALWLAIAFAAAAPAGGMATALAEGCLAEMSAGHRERAMARWMLAGSIGDLAAPALAAVLASVGLGWRSAMVLVAALLATHAALVLRGPRLFSPALDGDPETNGARLRDVVGRSALLGWLLAASTCALLDEVFVLVAGSWLRRGFGASRPASAVVIGLWAAGSVAGAFATERLLRRVSGRAVLAIASILCTSACLAWAAAPSLAWSSVALFAVGLAAAPLWPIATARAYASCPGRPALVGAVANAFVPLEMTLIAGAGHLADVAGARTALAAIALQPLVLLAALLARRGSIRVFEP